MEVQVTLGKVMESVFTPEFTDSKTLVLGLLSSHAEHNASLSGARLKEIYCTELCSF